VLLTIAPRRRRAASPTVGVDPSSGRLARRPKEPSTVQLSGAVRRLGGALKVEFADPAPARLRGVLPGYLSREGAGPWGPRRSEELQRTRRCRHVAGLGVRISGGSAKSSAPGDSPIFELRSAGAGETARHHNGEHVMAQQLFPTLERRNAAPARRRLARGHHQWLLARTGPGSAGNRQIANGSVGPSANRAFGSHLRPGCCAGGLFASLG